MATTADAGDVDGPTAYLERNADVVDVQEAKENDRESWQRALTEGGEADVDDLEETGRFLVELPDGSSAHDVLLVEDREGTLVGACDCDGWIMHGLACAHLCSLAQRDVLEDCISQHHGIAEQLRGARDDDPDDVDVVEDPVDDDRDDQDDDVHDEPDRVESDDVQEESESSGDAPKEAKPVEPGHSSPNAPVEPQGRDVEDRPATADMTVDQGPIEIAPEWAVSEIQERGGDLDLNKDGCQFVAAALGIDTDREFRVRGEENDFEFAVCECTATLGGRTVTREATAHIDESNVEKQDMNRMAETRAFKRAVKSISGGGIMAFVDADAS